MQQPVGQSPHRRSRSSGGQTHQDPPGPTTLMSPLHCNLLCCTFTYPRHCFGMCISLPNTLLADCTMQLHSAQCTVQCTAAQCNCRVQAVHSAPQHNATAHLESGISGSATKIPPQVREFPFEVKKKFFQKAEMRAECLVIISSTENKAAHTHCTKHRRQHKHKIKDKTQHVQY